MSKRPVDEYCPECGEYMSAQQAAGGYAPEGHEPEYDYYWCDACVMAFDLDEFNQESVMSNKSEGTGIA